MVTISYPLGIKRKKRIFDQTIRVYRKAVRYLEEIVLLHYDEMMDVKPGPKETYALARRRFIESLVHNTQSNVARYNAFDTRFAGFPSYFRREAVMTAIGTVMSYKELVKIWEDGGRKGRKPFFRRNQNVMPCFYRKNTFKQNGCRVALKLYDGKQWGWYEMEIRNTDFLYVLKNVSDWKKAAPMLVKRSRHYELRIAYEKANSFFPKFEKDKDVDTVLGVDLGINTDAVCSVVHRDGTVAGCRFIDHPVEKDRMYRLLNVIKKAQQAGNYKNRRLWRFVNNYNEAVARKTASEIVSYAVESNAKVIVFEFLKFNGKKRGSKKQRLSLWKKREIQERVKDMASRHGIRVSFICAVNTSKYAYDGSGKVIRGKDAGFENNQLCKFQNGKVFNCDLSASRNIGARYFIRVLLKSVPEKDLSSVRAKVPELCVRTHCVLSTLINFHAVLCTLKASGEAATAAPHAA